MSIATDTEADVSIPLQVSAHLAEAKTLIEDWTGKTSAKERRKLQNRLNQRARRRRRVRAPNGGGGGGGGDDGDDNDAPPLAPPPPPPPPSGQDFPQQVSSDDDVIQVASSTACRLGQVESRTALVRLAEESRRHYHAAAFDLAHLPVVIRYNVYDAFARNAGILGFGDAWLSYDAVSPLALDSGNYSNAAAPPSLPPSLQPTRSQLTVEHHPWIDFFPCPRLRDNILTTMMRYGDDFEDDLCSDVVDAGAASGDDGGRSALIAWGDSWEVAGWEVTERFWTKWGFLLDGCVDLLRSTNAWRRKRGLPGIRFPVSSPAAGGSSSLVVGSTG